ncbi:hypothetical protein JOQ06_004410 [Pogonophryne albipinna]|uniref:Ig-like domain-containing protein n=1 Tax=Pogonophryne albipinna TaxID=1090488 RepID=A0AAD6FCF2_9TELE|nr:hypothetical protein JOQ06_004410 [Pogonophryne albipinna]
MVTVMLVCSSSEGNTSRALLLLLPTFSQKHFPISSQKITLSHFEEATDSQATQILVILRTMTILHHGHQELVGGEFESPVTGQNPPSLTVRAGQSVTLPCGNVIKPQDKCNSTTWLYSRPVEWWWYIVAAVGFAALLIVIVAVIRWKKAKGDRPRMDDRIEQGLNPAVTQPGPENTADREEDVSYASVSYSKNTSSKNTSSKAQGQSKEDDEEDDLVTYSTVKAPSSSSAGVSADPRVTTHQRSISFIVKEGVEVTLPCNNAMGNFENTTWLFSHSNSTVTLFDCRVIHKEAKAKSDRLRVTDTCSLVIKKITEEDAGQYSCRQFRSGEQPQYQDSLVYLSVVNTNETQMDDHIRLTSNPAVTQSAPESCQDTAEPEDGVFYASISHTKNTNSQDQLPVGEDQVTYSTVKAPPSDADTVNKPTT